MLPNLRKTPHGYTYLKTVPADLQSVLGKTVVKKALGRNYSVVKVRWAELEAKTTALFQTTRQQLQGARGVEDAIKAYLAKPRATRLKALEANRPGLAAQLSALHLSGLASEAKARGPKGWRWLDDAESSKFTDEVNAVLELVKNAVVTGEVSAFIPVVEQLAESRGYRLVDTAGDDIQALTYEFLKSAQHGCRVLLARQNGEFAEPTIPEAEPLPAVWELGLQPKAIKPKKPRLSDVTSMYCDRLAVFNPKTQTTNLSWWNRLIEHCHDKELDEVTPTDIYEFFENRLNDPKKPWSMQYERTVAAGLREAFAIAKAKGLCHRNPVSELETMPVISGVEEKKRKKPRFPFSVAQLNILFSSAWYDCTAENWQQRMKWDLGARYWVPLLCLYHGFRVREPLQLLVCDVVDGTHPLIKIQVDENDDNDDDDDDDSEARSLPERRVKNQATRRAVPIHPVLLQLGFMDFVEIAKKNGDRSPLFPSALPRRSSKKPMWGRSYEQRFVPMVRDTLEFGRGYGNHSFRHSLEDCLRNTQLGGVWPPGLGQFYTGRTLPGDKDKGFFMELGSEQGYGDGYNPALIMPYVEKLQYKGLELPEPFARWLRGRPPVDEKLISLLDKEWGNDWRRGT